jgi:hypothetical protein
MSVALSAPAAVGSRSSDERRLAVGALRALGLLAVPVAGTAFAVAGWQGVASAMIGLSFVLLLFGASALLLDHVAARRPGPAGVGILVVGAVVRIPVYLVVLVLLEPVTWVHGRSLAGATALAIAVTLAYELHLLKRMPRLFWIDAAAATPPAVANDTRSRAL